MKNMIQQIYFAEGRSVIIGLPGSGQYIYVDRRGAAVIFSGNCRTQATFFGHPYEIS